MATITLYDVSIVTLQRGLVVLRNILQKAASHPDAASFPTAKLAEDMLPLTFQVQTTSNVAKKTVARLAGSPEAEAVWADDETTLEQLIARCDKTIDLLKSVKPEQLAGKDTANVELSLGPWGTRNLPGTDYAVGYAIPNFFFHLQAAYSILRMKGVEIGKADYLTPFLSPEA